MLSLRRFLRRSTPDNSAGTTGPAARSTALQTRILGVTESAEDAAELTAIAAESGWSVSVVSSSAAAIELLQRRPTPLVICDRDLPGEDWRRAVSALAAQPAVRCVLLASPVLDEYLLDEVIKHHGYDIVAKPFDAEQLRRAVTFASSWRE